jgi:addiction module RelB/DinJ family antitoxin
VRRPGKFDSLHEIVEKAHQVLPKEKWDSLTGGAETETTLKRNRLAIDSIAFKPRVLRDVSTVDVSVEHSGRKLRLPVFLVPTGPLNLFGSGGGTAAASAAQAFDIGHMLSSGCTPLETVAEAAPHALRMAQLYVRGNDSFVCEYVERALACGCAAICLTVDSAVLARRDRDIANRYRRLHMASNALVQTRIDAELKERATAVLENMGLTVSDAVRILLTRTANEGALPLELFSHSEAHDAWFRAKVLRALEDTRPDVDDADADAHFRERRAAALRKAAAGDR